jgi:hypothetical protein
VPICRAAFGALERLGHRSLYLAMQRRPRHRIIFKRTVTRPLRRWAREIALAAALTAVAAAFIANALLNGAEPSAYETARKPSTK